ncbi:helix-turn-helix transcriptional regulator [Devosia sp. XJ19-1]|nr:winged helix-turn-helix domain-containing protein [Devosia ureilytica]MCP8882335.1 helix-turn-helix transcriptional regulator [Devosia ureilytica]
MPVVVQFGPFILDLEARTLRDRDVELRLGARALDLLIALVRRAGELVTHQDLLLSAWNEINIDESSLRVHMSALRKALGDGQSGARYIINEHGRGYRFVGRTERRSMDARPAKALAPPHALPAQIVRMLGREDAVRSLSAAMQRSRLVTIAGPGGIGKSTLAIAWAERHAENFRDGVRFIDLLPINNVESAVRWISAVLGVTSSGATNPQQLAATVQGGEMLIVLDNCEHLIDFVTELVEALLAGAPEVHVLATSRETLRASGETLYRLAGLTYPDETPRSIGEAALYPAVELFIERATASAPALQLTEGEAGIVADICRRLDGIPLAIELAAGWIDVVGIHDLASQLDITLLSQLEGRRTASPRHRSLAATLEWSYAALDEDARRVLDRFSVFQTRFTLASATAVASGDGLRDDDVLRCIATLARKSLIQVDISGEVVHYRLLETTKAHALERLAQSGSEDAVRSRHARHCCDLLEGAADDMLTMGWTDWLGRYAGIMGDTRAALDWAFSPSGDPDLGVRLTLRSLPFGQQFPLTSEYLKHIETALAHSPSGRAESELDALKLGYARAMLISNISGDIAPFSSVAQRWRALEGETGAAIPDGITAQFGAAITSGDYPETLRAALRMEEVANADRAPEVKLAGMRMRAQAEHFLGRHDYAEQLARTVLAAPFEFLPLTQTSHRVSMRIVLSRIAFLRGENEEARILVEEALYYAGANPSAVCQTLGMAGVPLGFWIDELDYAERSMSRMAEVASRAGLTFWEDWLAAFSAALNLKRHGIEQPMPALDYPAKVVDLLPTLHQNLVGQAAVDRVERQIVGWNGPEVLRASALKLRDRREMIDGVGNALKLAQRQGAVAWSRRAQASLDELIGSSTARVPG